MVKAGDKEIEPGSKELEDLPLERIENYIEGAENLGRKKYEEAVKEKRPAYFYEVENPGQRKRFYSLFEQMNDLGMTKHLVDFSSQDENYPLSGMYSQIASGLGIIDSEEGGEITNIFQLEKEVSKISKHTGKKALFLIKPFNLSLDAHDQIRRLIDNNADDVQVFVLDSRKNAQKSIEDVLTSPLLLRLKEEEQQDFLPRFNVKQARQVMREFKRVVDELKEKKTGTIKLPMKSGKSTFARDVLAKRFPNSIAYVSVQGIETNDGEIDIEDFIKLQIDSKDLKNKIVIIDEAQVLSEVNKNQLESTRNKFIYLENEIEVR